MLNLNREELKRRVIEIENKVVKRWFDDRSRHKIDILIGNYLDEYEFERYNELKFILAGLKDKGQRV